MGISEIDIDPMMLKGDFDDEQHDKLMEEVMKSYGDEVPDEVDEDGELVKPVFSDMEEMEMEIQAEKKKKKVNRRKRGGRGRILEGDDFEEASEKFPEIAAEIEKLDYQVDLVGDVACKFNYRQTDAESYGLSVEEMLNATDVELNTWVSLKEVTQHENNGYTDNKFWNNTKKVEEKKRRVFQSIYGEKKDNDDEDEPKRKKKINSKRRRAQKDKEVAAAADEEASTSIATEEEPVLEPKLKKKKKLGGNANSAAKVLEKVQDDRLEAYGMTKKERKDYEKKMKYDPDQKLKY